MTHYFNETRDPERPGRIPCGACKVECQGDNAMEALTLLIAHLGDSHDDAHRAYTEKLQRELTEAGQRSRAQGRN